jgi:hypothetical protein
MSTSFLPDTVFGRMIARTDFLALGAVLSAACSALSALSTIRTLPIIAVAAGE